MLKYLIQQHSLPMQIYYIKGRRVYCITKLQERFVITINNEGLHIIWVDAVLVRIYNESIHFVQFNSFYEMITYLYWSYLKRMHLEWK